MIINKKKCVIVFSGFNQRAVIAFLRTLKVNKIDYALIAKSQQDDIILTEYKDKVLAVRNSSNLILEDLLSSIKRVKESCSAQEFIIAPTTEALNRFILDNRKYFEELGCTIPLVEKEMYELISDKYSFGKLCSKNDILIPKEIKNVNENVFPIVAKPRKYFSAIKKEGLYPIIINDISDYKNFYTYYDVNDFYYQEYIRGRSLYLLYYFHRNGQVYKFSQENLVQQPEGKSMLAAMSSDFHNSAESHKYEKMFKNLNYHGFVMVEVKQIKDKNYMIEANPRFWGPSQLFVDAEMNFFEAFLHDYGLIKVLPKFKEPKHKIKYFWFGGLINIRKNNLNLTYYNISENDFISELPVWLQNDIYLRDDTIEIFKKELLYGL